MPILESALGIEHAFDIAAALERVVALTIGLEDYTADIGVPQDRGGRRVRLRARRLVNAARAAGVQAIDSVYGEVDDEDRALRAGRARARRTGLRRAWAVCTRGRSCRSTRPSPRQPSQIEKRAADRGRLRGGRGEGLGVVSLGSKMIDPPVVKRALRTVQAARRAGLLEDGAGGDSQRREPPPRPNCSTNAVGRKVPSHVNGTRPCPTRASAPPSRRAASTDRRSAAARTIPPTATSG